MKKYAQFGRLTTSPENRPALIAILQQAVAIMDEIEACHHYILYEDSKDAGAVWVSEIWTDKAAHDASLAREDVRQLIGQAMPLLTEQPSGGAQLLPVAGKGI